MKKQVLFFAAGVFLTLSVFAFWAFKSKTEEAGGKYAVVELNGNLKHAFVTYPDGKIEHKQIKDKSISEIYALLLNEMDAAGYTFIESNLQIFSGTTNGAILTFKKK